MSQSPLLARSCSACSRTSRKTDISQRPAARIFPAAGLFHAPSPRLPRHPLPSYKQAEVLRPRLRRRRPRDHQLLRLAGPAPEIAGTEKPAQRASFDPKGVRPAHGNRRVVGVLAVVAIDVA